MTQNQIFLKSKQMTHSVSITLVHSENCVCINLVPGILTREVQFCSVQSLSRVQHFATHESQHTRLPVHHQLPELAQTHVYRVGDAIQPSYPLLSPSPPANKTSL